MSQFNKGEPEDVNMQLFGLANTRISTAYAQKSPWSLLPATTLSAWGLWNYKFVNRYGLSLEIRAKKISLSACEEAWIKERDRVVAIRPSFHAKGFIINHNLSSSKGRHNRAASLKAKAKLTTLIMWAHSRVTYRDGKGRKKVRACIFLEVVGHLTLINQWSPSVHIVTYFVSPLG